MFGGDRAASLPALLSVGLTVVVVGSFATRSLVIESTPEVVAASSQRAGAHDAAPAAGSGNALPGPSPAPTPSPTALPSGSQPAPGPTSAPASTSTDGAVAPLAFRSAASADLSATPTPSASPSPDTTRPTADLTFGQFNIQGAIHRGRVAQRMSGVLGLLRSHGVEVGALQEFEGSQRRLFDQMAGGTYARYPTAGRSLDAENSVIWDKSRFVMLKGETRPYPYFHGATRNMPRVLLRDRISGVSFWVTSYHNPADVFGNAAGFRATAVSRQVADANALRSSTRAPILVSGDMNDRATYFCRMASGTGMHSADGSTYSGGCNVAKSPWIDWVIGTADVTFSGYTRDRGTADRAASDHPIVVTQMRVTGRLGEGSCHTAADGSVAANCPYPTGTEPPSA